MVNQEAVCVRVTPKSLRTGRIQHNCPCNTHLFNECVYGTCTCKIHFGSPHQTLMDSTGDDYPTCMRNVPPPQCSEPVGQSVFSFKVTDVCLSCETLYQFDSHKCTSVEKDSSRFPSGNSAIRGLCK